MWRDILADYLDPLDIDWEDTDLRVQLGKIEDVSRREISLSSLDRVDMDGADCIRDEPEVRKAMADDVITLNPDELQDFVDGNIKPRSWAVKELLYRHRLPENLLIENPSSRQQPAIEVIDRPKPLWELRDYQEELVKEIVSRLDLGSSACLLSLPTGAGKTRVTLEGVLQWLDNRTEPSTVWWFAETKQLCRQAAGSSKEVWTDFALRGSKGGGGLGLRLLRHWDANDALPPDPHSSDNHNLVISTYQQTDRRLEDPNSTARDWLRSASVLVFDEAHLWPDGQARVIDASSAKHRLGLTATPYWDDPIRTAQITRRYPTPLIPVKTLGLIELKGLAERLTERGYLSELEECNQTVWDVLSNSNVGHIHSNLSRKDNHGHRRALRDLVVDLLTEEGKKSVLVFVTEIEEANMMSLAINRRLRELGQSELSRAVHSKKGSRETDEIISNFKDGEISCLINVEMLTAGFDAPCIDCVVIAKNVREESNRSQMVGRGLRGPQTPGGTESCLAVYLES